MIFRDSFENLNRWQWEGGGKASIPEKGILRLDCTGSVMGGVACMLFCRKDFPDHIAVEYDLLVRQSNGLVITFVAMRGLKGEDVLTGLPPRKGEFDDYVADNAPMRSYHVSVSRYDDKGVHSGVCNWRRNPGLHLMGQGNDPCKETGRKYAIRIEKDGPRCAIFVNGKPGPAFVDPQTLPDAIPTDGKIGFRAIGSKVVADISNFRVLRLPAK